MKVRYLVEVDFHPATPALRRISQMFDLLADVYGVNSITRTVIAEPEAETEAERIVD